MWWSGGLFFELLSIIFFKSFVTTFLKIFPVTIVGGLQVRFSVQLEYGFTVVTATVQATVYHK